MFIVRQCLFFHKLVPRDSSQSPFQSLDLNILMILHQQLMHLMSQSHHNIVACKWVFRVERFTKAHKNGRFFKNCEKRSGNSVMALKLHQEARNWNGTPNSVCYNTLIHGLCKEGLVDEGKQLFLEMKGSGIMPNLVTYGGLIHGLNEALCKMRKTNEVRGLLNLMIQKGEEPNSLTYGILMNGFCLENRIDNAKELFDFRGAKGHKKNDVCYGVLISGFCNVEVARGLFVKMKVYEVIPDTATYTKLLDGFFKNNCVADAMELFHSLEISSFDLHIEVYNRVLDGLCKAGEIDIAKRESLILPLSYLKACPKRAWHQQLLPLNIMINGFCKNGEMEKANNLFLEMEKESCAPVVVTFNTLMRGFCNNNEAPKVIELLHEMAERNSSPDEYTVVLVINLVCKDSKYLSLIPRSQGGLLLGGGSHFSLEKQERSH
ncbi:unnamed protein product [Fraxinus pennsylvanica]|uniref:Pentatricopeptide repeat-containing protein n=1 Tax=Fraxinus pennsylvanica TaxID=56036 RepID=A0AAD2A499_9LAMI|nr:unnamed protein product [Fraxinus pennsylvanica]